MVLSLIIFDQHHNYLLQFPLENRKMAFIDKDADDVHVITAIFQGSFLLVYHTYESSLFSYKDFIDENNHTMCWHGIKKFSAHQIYVVM